MTRGKNFDNSPRPFLKNTSPDGIFLPYLDTILVESVRLIKLPFGDGRSASAFFCHSGGSEITRQKTKTGEPGRTPSSADRDDGGYYTCLHARASSCGTMHSPSVNCQKRPHQYSDNPASCYCRTQRFPARGFVAPEVPFPCLRKDGPCPSQGQEPGACRPFQNKSRKQDPGQAV